MADSSGQGLPPRRARLGGQGSTLKDVAREVGLSVMAISKALNGKGGVSEASMARILEAVRRLNYTPNSIAKSLRMGGSGSIGVVVSDSSHAVFATVVKGIEETAAARGYSIILCNTDQDREREMRAIEVLRSKRIDGLVLAASKLTRASDLPFLRSTGIPIVFVIRRSETRELDYVVNDNVLGSYLMASHLVERAGAQPRFINLPEDSPSGDDRLVGYRQALEERGLAFDPGMVMRVSPTIDEGRRAMGAIIASGERSGAIFCGCDMIAIGVIEAILERGLGVPGDFLVGAYDDIDFAPYLRVPLTTVRQPKYEIGRAGAELLIERIADPSLPARQLILKPELVLRQSS